MYCSGNLHTHESGASFAGNQPVPGEPTRRPFRKAARAPADAAIAGSRER